VSRIYKILEGEAWRDAQAKGRFEGAGVDLADGFIHFSTAAQVRETARRYFRDQAGLVVLEVEADDLGAELRWEASRGGDLFPHLYGTLPCAVVRAVHPAPLDGAGEPSVDGIGA
jgi:uncharacterized protein (DUF952 family)